MLIVRGQERLNPYVFFNYSSGSWWLGWLVHCNLAQFFTVDDLHASWFTWTIAARIKASKRQVARGIVKMSEVCNQASNVNILFFPWGIWDKSTHRCSQGVPDKICTVVWPRRVVFFANNSDKLVCVPTLCLYCSRPMFNNSPVQHLTIQTTKAEAYNFGKFSVFPSLLRWECAMTILKVVHAGW